MCAKLLEIVTCVSCFTQAHSSMQIWYLPLPGSLLGLACSACLLCTAQARMTQFALPGCKICSGLQASMTSVVLFGTSQILYIAAAMVVAKAAGSAGVLDVKTAKGSERQTLRALRLENQECCLEPKS